jgi:hypothetical protein
MSAGKIVNASKGKVQSFPQGVPSPSADSKFVWAYPNFISILNFLTILKMFLVYSKVGFYYINWTILVYLKHFEYTLKIWVDLKIWDGLGISGEFKLKFPKLSRDVLIGEITSKLIVSENNICKCYTCDKNQIMSQLFHSTFTLIFDCSIVKIVSHGFTKNEIKFPLFTN